METPARYLHWAFILISQPNMFVIAAMIVLFILALVLPFPGRAARRDARR